MPLCGATTDENNRPPLDKGGLQGDGAQNLRKPPPDPLLVQEGGGTSFAGEIRVWKYPISVKALCRVGVQMGLLVPARGQVSVLKPLKGMLMSSEKEAQTRSLLML